MFVLISIYSITFVSLPRHTDPKKESKELNEHVLKCWDPTDVPAMGIYDERVKIPTMEDEECLLLSVHTPGAFGGAYMMVLAFP